MNVLVNMSQMTVSQVDISNTSPSRQRWKHWLGEQAFLWADLSVVTVRPPMSFETFLRLISPIIRDRGRIEPPFGRGKRSSVEASDAVRVVDALLAGPGQHLGRVYLLTGPCSQDLDGVAHKLSDALNWEVAYSNILRRLGGGAQEAGVA